MKRILALDGGGIRGVFSLEILLRMERMLRRHYGRDDLVLRDHFDFFAGVSTGAIIATCLCWGMTVEAVLDLFVRLGPAMFQPVPWYLPWKKLLFSRFDARPLSEILLRLFSEDGAGRIPALLGTDKMRTQDGQLKLLMIVVRNHSTGSAWPLTNNPKAMFNDRSNPQCNLNIPLYQLVRASTAAPTFFDPEVIHLGDVDSVFVDGSITPYTNPALIAALTAVLPCYSLNWDAGPDKIRIVSLGTIRFSSGLPPNAGNLWLGYHARHIPGALIEGVAAQQDFLCRCLGQCLFGEQVDSEVSDMIGVTLPGTRWFSYVRYNRSYSRGDLESILRRHPQIARLDAVHAIPLLRDVGQKYAEEHVRIEHLV